MLQSKAGIKNLLMDQYLISGIGNAYANEILWDAGIAPSSVGNKIPDDKIKHLAKSIKKVLKNAEKKVLKNHPDIISGEVRDFLDIHNAKKQNSPSGGEIKHEMVNGKKTYYNGLMCAVGLNEKANWDTDRDIARDLIYEIGKAIELKENE